PLPCVYPPCLVSRTAHRGFRCDHVCHSLPPALVWWHEGGPIPLLRLPVLLPRRRSRHEGAVRSSHAVRDGVAASRARSLYAGFDTPRLHSFTRSSDVSRGVESRLHYIHEKRRGRLDETAAAPVGPADRRAWPCPQ